MKSRENAKKYVKRRTYFIDKHFVGDSRTIHHCRFLWIGIQRQHQWNNNESQLGTMYMLSTLVGFIVEDEINDYEDIDNDSDVEAPKAELHELSQFENHEVDPSLFESFDFDENNIFQGLDAPNSDLEIVPLYYQILSDDSIKQVKENDKSTEKDSSKTIYICLK